MCLRARNQRLRRGVTLDDGTKTRLRRLEKSVKPRLILVEILSHEVRTSRSGVCLILIGHSVIQNCAARVGSLRDDELKPARWRHITEDEVKLLTETSNSEPGPVRPEREARPSGRSLRGRARRSSQDSSEREPPTDNPAAPPHSQGVVMTDLSQGAVTFQNAQAV